MAGLVGLIKNKPKPVANVSDNNPYAMAMCMPAETDRIFDGELKLLLMDGLLYFLLFPLSVVSNLREQAEHKFKHQNRLRCFFIYSQDMGFKTLCLLQRGCSSGQPRYRQNRRRDPAV